MARKAKNRAPFLIYCLQPVAGRYICVNKTLLRRSMPNLFLSIYSQSQCILLALILRHRWAALADGYFLH